LKVLLKVETGAGGTFFKNYPHQERHLLVLAHQPSSAVGIEKTGDYNASISSVFFLASMYSWTGRRKDILNRECEPYVRIMCSIKKLGTLAKRFIYLWTSNT